MELPLKLTNAKRKQLPEVKKSLREKIPYLTVQQIRRLKLPIVDALKLELEEENHVKTLKNFTKIIELDKNHNNCFTNSKNKKLLEEIFNSLKEIEQKTDEEEIKVLLEIIKKLFNEGENFDWLIEFLFIKSHQLVDDYGLGHSKTYTLLAYFHGISLSYRLQWYRAALLQFESAFNNALRNDNSDCEDEKFFCVIISQELSGCLIKLSKQIRVDGKNPKEASIYAGRALTILRKIMTSKNFEWEINAEIEYGDCLLDQCFFDEAKSHYEHAFALSENFKINEKYCECLIKIAKCHKGLKNIEKYKDILEISEKYSTENNLEHLTGDILILQMEYYIENFDIDKINEIFVKAFVCFTNNDDQQKLMEIETIFAHATAKMSFKLVIDTILKSDKSQTGVNSYLQKLINWIDQKSSKYLEDEKFEELSLDDFIKKYYDPDEIVRVNRQTI